MSKTTPPLRLMLDIPAWQSETIALAAAERGALLALKMYFWRHGPIPDRDQALAQIVGMDLKDWKRARKSIEPLFIVKHGEWQRVDWADELKAAYEAVNRAKEKSQKGNEARWAKRRNAQAAHPTGNPTGNPARSRPSIPAAILNNKGGDFAPCAPIPSQGDDDFSDGFAADVRIAERHLGIRGAA